MSLKNILTLLFRYLVTAGKVEEQFSGEVIISFHNGIPTKKYKVVETHITE
jgi:hypothetical protein